MVIAAWAYPAALLATWLGLALIGERWWVTTALLYVPCIAFGAPLVVLVPALLLMRRRQLIWTQALAFMLTLFPLMGVVLPGLGGHNAGPTLTLMSFNVNSEAEGVAQIVHEIGANSPDVVLLQEVSPNSALQELLKPRFPYTEASTQFIIASRYPITERTDPAKIPFEGHERSPRFMRYVVDSPLGRLAIYSLHPLSPRGALGIYRFRGALRRLRSGEFLAGDPEADVGANARLRDAQIRISSEMAAKESLPVLLAGDTNLPGLSAIRRRYLSGYGDAFRQASWGFGYTYPAQHPWMRLDRIMADHRLRFTDFHVGCAGASDHLCVVARIVRP